MKFRTIVVCVVAVGVAPVIAQDTGGVGSVSGTVSGSAGERAPGAMVCVAGTTRCATTDEAGAFRITEIRAGRYRLTVEGVGPTVSSEPFTIRAGLEERIEVALPAIDAVQQSVTVSAPVFIAPEEVKGSSFLIQPNEIFKSAGALQDVSRYVQTLPGVVTGSNDFRNDIIVRGGSPLENLFVVDNIEIPNINAFANFASAGGTVSLLDAALIQDVTFLTGGYPAPFINRTSSVMQITQREGNRDRMGGMATLGFAGLGAVLEGPVGKGGKGSWITSIRRSFLDAFTDDIGFGGVPVLYTLNAKVLYDLTPRDRVWAVNVSGRDNIRLGARESGDNTEEVNNLDINYTGWRSATGFNWQRLFGSRGVGLLGVTHSEARVNQSARDLVRGGIPPPDISFDQLLAGGDLVYREDSGEGETTLKYDLTAYAPLFEKVQAGGSYKTFRINYDAASPFGTDSPYSLTAELNPFAIRQRYRSSQTGAYFQSTRNLTSRLNLTWGGRLDQYEYLDRMTFSPRAGVSYQLTDKLSWRGSFGTYFQQPFFLFLSAFPENRGLRPWRANHYVTGFSYIASNTLRFTLEGYRKDYRDYPVATQLPQVSLATLGDTFAIRQVLFPLTSAGRGRVRGIELFAEKKFSDRWFGQANLSFSKTRHAGLDGVLRPGSFDYPRVLSTVGGYRLNSKWEFSARFAYLSGRPYTPFDAELSTAQRRGIYDLARVNALRLPAYVRLDLRVDRIFTVRDKPLLVFAGFQNAVNRKNVAGYTWNRRANAQEENTQLGLFPLIGMEWRF
ncbi:MAG: TonB-dependent receptor [Bryobacteraceae bacterium]